MVGRLPSIRDRCVRSLLRCRHSRQAAEQPKCPVMLHFGEQDAHIPIDSVEAFKRVHPSLPVHIYAADHGFNCDQRGSYDAAAARLALERTIEFLHRHEG